MALFDENMAVGKSKYLVTLYLHELKQPSDRVISGGPLILFDNMYRVKLYAVRNLLATLKMLWQRNKSLPRYSPFFFLSESLS